MSDVWKKNQLHQLDLEQQEYPDLEHLGRPVAAMLPEYDNPRLTVLNEGVGAMLPEGCTLVSASAPHPEILYEENFLTAEECDRLVSCFDRYAPEVPKSGNGDLSFFLQYPTMTSPEFGLITWPEIIAVSAEASHATA